MKNANLIPSVEDNSADTEFRLYYDLFDNKVKFDAEDATAVGYNIKIGSHVTVLSLPLFNVMISDSTDKKDY